jgi:hypothetical protein
MQSRTTDSVSDPNAPVHRLFIIDCSGSMGGTLPGICTTLKNKIPVLTESKDFVSILWFHSKNHFGTLLEHVPVGTLTDIQAMNAAIDRHLVASGATHFAQAMEMAAGLTKKYAADISQIFFLTDGGENEDRSATDAVFQKLHVPSVFVAYGNYADSEYLTSLAEMCDANVVTSNTFERLNFIFESHMNNKVVAGYMPFVPEAETAHCFAFENNDVTIFRKNESAYRVPRSVQTFFEFDTAKIDGLEGDALYTALAYALKTNDDDLMWKLLKKSGDVYFIKKYNNCFTKQDYLDLTDEIMAAVSDSTLRGKSGIDPSCVPQDDCTTVIDVLSALAADPQARIFPYHPEFKYSRIGKKAAKNENFYFVANKEIGSKIQLVYNKSRANVSINCTVHGHNVWTDGSDKIEPTTVFRNYTVVKDGVKNVQKLVVKCSLATFDSFHFIEEMWEAKKTFVIDLADIPVVNRKTRELLKNRNFDSFLQAHLQRYILQSHRKFLKSTVKVVKAEVDGETSETASETKSEGPADFYIARELQVTLKSLSSIPTVNEKLMAKFAADKASTLSECVMYAMYEQWAAVSEESREEWTTAKISAINEELAALEPQIEAIKFAILTAKNWQTEPMVFDVNHPKWSTTATMKIVEKQVML